jgi:hypothetical protein
VKLMDKSERKDGTFSRSDFAFDPDRNLYVCPGGKELRKHHRAFAKGAKDEFLLAATAQNLRKLAKLIPLPTPVFAT